MISIGPVYAGHSSPQEIKTYHLYANSNGVPYEEDPSNLFNSGSEDEESTCEVQQWPDVLECAPTYPSKPAYSTITLHNYTYVTLDSVKLSSVYVCTMYRIARKFGGS